MDSIHLQSALVEASVLEKKIMKQVEYYFGDYNLPRDKFLQEEMAVQRDWVDVTTLMSFNRLAQLSTDPNVILTALRKSQTGMLEIQGEHHEGKVRRKCPLPQNNEERKKNVEARTVHVKGFNKEGTTQDELLDYFHESFENVANVSMRYLFVKGTKEKHFKGSVFVTFEDFESADKFVKYEEIKFGDNELFRTFQKAYFEQKLNKLAAKKKIMEVNLNLQKQVTGEKTVPELPKGTLLKIKGLSCHTTREDIQEKLSTTFNVNMEKKIGDVAFISYNQGEEEAIVRFRGENGAKYVVGKWKEEVDVKINEVAVTVELMEGEKEEEFLAQAAKELTRQKNKGKVGTKRRGGSQGRPGGKKIKL